MDPVSLVVGALAAGAVSVLEKSTAAAVRGAYEGLRGRLRKLWSRQPAAVAVLDQYVAEPGAHEALLRHFLQQGDVVTDADVLVLAGRLMELIDPAGAAAGRYAVDLRGAQGGYGLQFGGPNIQINTFAPAAARVSWPVQVGAVPLRADGYQARPQAAELAAMGSGGIAVVTQVLSGLGGVGKTQLAAGFARDLWDAGGLDLLVWVTAASRDAVVSSYAQVHAEISGVAGERAERAATGFLAWLQTTSRRWLVVLDDVADPADVQGLWPHGPAGRGLVTTRRRDAVLAGGHRRMIEVGVFTCEQAVAYLTAKLGADSHQLDGAAELAEDLGRLPLALAQAAAFLLDRPGETCRSYRCRLADRQQRLAEVLPADALADDYRSTVAATWSLSIEQANRLPRSGWLPRS
jgi:hypothetical protein